MTKKYVDVKCENKSCGKIFKKYKSEYKRSIKLGRKQYCSLSCYGKEQGYVAFNSVPEEKRIELQNNIKNYCGSNRDEYTEFRYFLKMMKNKNRKSKYNEGEMTLEYLKKLWENQNGKCPITGCDLILPSSTMGWEIKKETKWKRASIDRIDNSKGYVIGNVRFISYMANIARNNMTDIELIQFCRAVSGHNK